MELLLARAGFDFVAAEEIRALQSESKPEKSYSVKSGTGVCECALLPLGVDRQASDIHGFVLAEAKAEDDSVTSVLYRTRVGGNQYAIFETPPRQATYTAWYVDLDRLIADWPRFDDMTKDLIVAAGLATTVGIATHPSAAVDTEYELERYADRPLKFTGRKLSRAEAQHESGSATLYHANSGHYVIAWENLPGRRGNDVTVYADRDELISAWPRFAQLTQEAIKAAGIDAAERID